MKFLLCFVAIGFSGAVCSLNISVSDLSANYLKDVFLEKASKIPDIPVPNACQRQLLFLSKNWKKLNIFPSEFLSFSLFKGDLK